MTWIRRWASQRCTDCCAVRRCQTSQRTRPDRSSYRHCQIPGLRRLSEMCTTPPAKAQWRQPDQICTITELKINNHGETMSGHFKDNLGKPPPNTHAHNHLMALLSGTTRVSLYQKKHSPTHTCQEEEGFTPTTRSLHGKCHVCLCVGSSPRILVLQK